MSAEVTIFELSTECSDSPARYLYGKESTQASLAQRFLLSKKKAEETFPTSSPAADQAVANAEGPTLRDGSSAPFGARRASNLRSIAAQLGVEVRARSPPRGR